MDIELLYNFASLFIFYSTLFALARKLSFFLKKKIPFRDSFLIANGGGGKGGGGSSYTPPPAPDPTATANAQGAQDRQTAQTNAVLLNPNIQSPYGTISYDTNSYNVDNNNNTVNRPTQTITLSPQEQTILNSKLGAGQTIAGGLQPLADYLSKNAVFNPTTPTVPQSIDYSGVSKVPSPSDFSADATKDANAFYSSQTSLLQPQFDQQRRQLSDQLVASGNPLGSEAYTTAMGNFDRDMNTVLGNIADQATVQGYGLQNQEFEQGLQGMNAQIAAAQLPYQTSQTIASNDIAQNQAIENENINALSAFTQGTPAIQNPSGAGYSQNPLSAPNLMGLTSQNYQTASNNALQAYQINSANNNAFNSGLFSIGAAVANPLTSYYFSNPQPSTNNFFGMPGV